MGERVIKLKDTEASRLTALLIAICRPRSPEEAAQLDYWLQRLRGSKS